jgi:hypothetical protein
MKNTINVKISIPNEMVLKRLLFTPVFQRLTKIKLKLGDNFETVNHFQYSEQVRLFTIGGATVEKVNN